MTKTLEERTVVCTHSKLRFVGMQELETGQYLPLGMCLGCNTSLLAHPEAYKPIGNMKYYVRRR